MYRMRVLLPTAVGHSANYFHSIPSDLASRVHSFYLIILLLLILNLNVSPNSRIPGRSLIYPVFVVHRVKCIECVSYYRPQSTTLWIVLVKSIPSNRGFAYALFYLVHFILSSTIRCWLIEWAVAHIIIWAKFRNFGLKKVFIRRTLKILYI